LPRAAMDRAANWTYAKGLGRAFAGGVIFALPILMTMEMWWLGFTLSRLHLLQFVLVNLVVLVGLSHVSGFEQTESWFDDLLDAFAAFGIGAAASFVVLLLLGIVTTGMSLGEVVGKVAIQAVPASFGAMLASKQLGEQDDNQEVKDRSHYVWQLFLMMAGALFLGFNIAPTEEMIAIAFRMSSWHALALVAFSITLLHLLVYTVGFRGEEKRADTASFFGVLMRYSIVGYAIAVLVSLYVLWTFGRTDGAGATHIVGMVVVLAFPSAIGAAIARLVV
jgi:putative integral membrane protein (TIGR02587 family)